MVSQRSSNQDRVKPKKLVLVAIIAAANGIGLFPYLLFIEQVRYLPVVVAVAALIGFFALRPLETEAKERPSLAEWLLAAWSATAYPSVAALGCLIWYGIGFGLASLASYLLKLFNFTLAIDPSTWGYWVSLPFAAVFAFALPFPGARDLFHNLYPRTAGSRSAFFQLLGGPWKIDTRTAGSRSAFFQLLGGPWKIALFFAAFVAALTIMFVFLDPRRTWFPILLSLLICYSSLPLARLGERTPTRRQTETVERLARLLEGAGYNVTRAPRTGKPEVDPLIRNIDMLARSEARAFAVEVKSSDSPAPVEWNEAASLRTASAVLQDELAGEAEAHLRIEPILVLVGGSLAPSLEQFSQKEGIPVLHVADPLIFEAGSDRIGDRLRAIGVPFPADELAPPLGAV